jgi:predicted dehydrogenase
MIKVGVAGLGMMGTTHLQVYGERSDVTVVAIADADSDRLSGKAAAQGNIEGQARGGVDIASARKYASAEELIRDPDVDLVDICLPTPLHLEYGRKVIEAGKHLMMEKPAARTAAEAFELAKIVEASPQIAMPGMCMRFWPGWDWLKQAIDEKRYGPVLAATFRRVTSHPGGPFYSDGEACGGALLDLHVHDTDFVQHCFGTPASVFSRGYSAITTEPDHVVTQYLYDGGPVVMAEGAWSMSAGFGFQMQFTVNFENATAQFDLATDPVLRLVQSGKSEAVPMAAGMGYEHEIAYLLDCVGKGQKPTRVTMRDAAVSVAIVEAERESLKSGAPVAVRAEA